MRRFPVRVAVLADVHGNVPALEAVLRDVAAAGVDAVVLNGDIAGGPMPGETLDRLAELGERAIWVHGNGERELVEAYDRVPGRVEDERTEYCASRLSRQQRDLIADLPMSVVLDVTGLGPVRFCHATMRDDAEMVLVDSSVDLYREAFAGSDEATVVLGHTHMPFDRLADRRRFVNPGSVGMPYGGTGAYWALLGPDVVLRRTDYDLNAAAETLRAAAPDFPDIAEFIEANLLTTASDAEALAAFSA
ncbi:metallophosphoesterase family protein [Saccharopolyspora oryzae]|uniref:Metallophosphoesterase family protein n=1 Tax=Saccharopolyspora oryzae TaxID=2997343 RepID=A0ABT4V536_9PSEU|nr:metallophosphoesterase family protein [Saccharopolyspora oryzae]MDA3628509.1 metallophosphoesterase family protein [Saccharopolyspora oryzae]